jgi:hypothetical protein
LTADPVVEDEPPPSWRARLSAATTPGTPPPTSGRWAQLRWGAAQPLLGLRVLFQRGPFRAYLPAPLICLLGICAAYATLWLSVRPAEVTWTLWLSSFYKAFASLAIVPATFFADHYFRMAAHARETFGFGPQRPRREGWRKALNLAIQQALCIGTPVAILVSFIFLTVLVVEAPGVLQLERYTSPESLELATRVIYWVLVVPWMIQWIAVDAMDSARVLGADGQASDAGEVGRPPRLARWLRWLGVGFLMQRWSRPWWQEFAIYERQVWIALGFTATTAVILATPGLQFVFRPAIVLAAAHWLGHVEAASRSRSA